MELHLHPRLTMRASLVLLSLILFACGPTASKETLPKCLPGTPGEVSVFAPDIGVSEGIAFLNGKAYVSGKRDIQEISADGSAKTIATLPWSIGLVAWNGALYVASRTESAGRTFCDFQGKGVIYKIIPGEEPSVFATGLQLPNFITVTPWHTLLVSDSCVSNPNIWEVTATGAVSVWNSDLFSSNGMVFNPAGDALFVASTFTDPAPIWKLSIGAQKPTSKTSFLDYDSRDTPDGLAMDIKGNVYVALNAGQKINRVAPDGSEETIASDLPFPASMAFGDGEGFDPCSIYSTSVFLGTHLNRVVVGVPGAPLFK